MQFESFFLHKLFVAMCQCAQSRHNPDLHHSSSSMTQVLVVRPIFHHLCFFFGHSSSAGWLLPEEIDGSAKARAVDQCVFILDDLEDVLSH